MIIMIRHVQSENTNSAKPLPYKNGRNIEQESLPKDIIALPRHHDLGLQSRENLFFFLEMFMLKFVSFYVSVTFLFRFKCQYCEGTVLLI